MFDQYKENLVSENKNSSVTLTGIGEIKVLAINPTEATLTELIGKRGGKAFDTVYAKKNNMGVMERPVIFWVQDVEELGQPFPVQINLTDTDYVASTGSLKIINNNLQDSWSASIETLTSNPRMSWFSQEGIRVAKKGELAYSKFLSILLNIKMQEGNYQEILASESLDFNSVFNGNFDGLRSLTTYLNANDSTLVGLFTAKETVNDKGTFTRQKFLMRPDTWFKYKGDKVVNALQKQRDNALERGTDLTNNFFTFELMKFDKSKCFNAEPDFETQTTKAASPWT